jgi:SAM-dependent methyltransferase
VRNYTNHEEELAKMVFALTRKENFNVLDYGCGDGQFARLLAERGANAYGTDLFYEGAEKKIKDEAINLLGDRVAVLQNGVIPFEDSFFDVVVSNTVFEHIEDWSLPLREISRVLKPNGWFLNVFPIRETWREGHIGIPLVHRMQPGSYLRYHYTVTMRRLGFGLYKEELTPAEWARVKLKWIDDWTYYKSLTQIEALFRDYFELREGLEPEYMIGRILKHRILKYFAAPLTLNIFRSPLRFACSRLGTRIFVLRNTKSDF